MALRAIDVATTEARSRPARPTARHAAPSRTSTAQAVPSLTTPLLAPPRTATITELRPRSRVEALAAARRERRTWFVIGLLVFATPFAACLGVLEVVR
jgi:hypothetical protein